MKKMLLPMLLIGAVISSCGATNQPAQNPPITYAKKSLLPAKIPTVVENSVFFPLNAKSVPSTYNKLISYNASYLKDNPKATVILFSYATESKDKSVNINLAKERVSEVKDALMKDGVNPAQITVRILQEKHPDNQKNIVTKNQRVDIIYEIEAPNFYHYDNKKPTIEMP